MYIEFRIYFWLAFQLLYCLPCSVISVSASVVNARSTRTRPPNFVLMMADDLGIGDIGCFGNGTMRTPNVDKIAAGGAKLTHHISAESLCTPSRAAFLTGRYPIRSGMASDRVRVLLYLSNSGGLPRNETTFAEIVSKAGYATGLIGKWHQGLNLESSSDHYHHPLNQGFEYFYGLPHSNMQECDLVSESQVIQNRYPNIYRHIVLIGLLTVTTLLLLKEMTLITWNAVIGWTVTIVILTTLLIGIVRNSGMFNCVLMRNHDVIELPVQLRTLTSRMTREAVNFIEQNKERPFLLFLAYPQPHTALVPSDKFKGTSKHGHYGDCVEEMDWSIGSVLDTLSRLDLYNDTVVYFSSDHGGQVELNDQGGWNGIYKGGKGQTTEGGIRVPGAIRYPRMIPKGTVINEPTSLMDILPTLATLSGESLPSDRVIDGQNIMPLLTAREKVSPHKFLFHYCGKKIHAARYRPRFGNATYKAYFATPNWTPGTYGCFETLNCACHKSIHHDPPLLYNLSLDPREDNALNVSDVKYSDIVNRIKDAVAEHKSTIIPVQDQLIWTNIIPKPWLQPICGLPPFITCQESIMS
ncbi:arylsulfatase L-like [Saccoglossus kowalevskii]|uniref:Arylsulfatase E-like n=1 Tax=Saccoglossus kowalevskii TaxID=10224 RepID=A0ABM0MCR5_SACKO|nr:PREDICTED: arylsulfatase E-like [Saccoglossus kowalevskii]